VCSRASEWFTVCSLYAIENINTTLIVLIVMVLDVERTYKRDSVPPGCALPQKPRRTVSRFCEMIPVRREGPIQFELCGSHKREPRLDHIV
jgi:hypothetical protein